MEYDNPEQIEALQGLENNMRDLMRSVITCNQEGIPMADAFEAIGMEIPLFLRPMLNQLAEKLTNHLQETQALETGM